MRRLVATLGVLAAALLAAQPAAAVLQRLPSGKWVSYMPIRPARTPAAVSPPDASFTNVDYGGGPVMASNANYEIVWNPSNYSGQPFQTGYVAGVARYFSDLAADSGKSSNSEAVASQYNDAAGATAAYNSSFAGTLTDTDPLPANGCPANAGDICLTDAQMQTELASFLAANSLPRDLAHEYFLFTPPSVASCEDAAGTDCSFNADQAQTYCAYHSYSSTSPGFVYAIMPDPDGSKCDSYVTGCQLLGLSSCQYPNSPADGVIYAISHEQNESTTDPVPGTGWADWSTGSDSTGEIADKCATTVDPATVDNPQPDGRDAPYNEAINGTHYLVNMMWSNQTHRCRDSFTPNGTSVSASFTYTLGPGGTVNYDAGASTASDGIADYVWQFDDAPGDTTTYETTSPTISHTFTVPGTYRVGLTVLGADGTSSGTGQVIVDDFTPPSPTPIAFVGNYHSDAVLPIAMPDPSTFDLAQPIQLGFPADPVGIVASPDGQSVYTALSTANSLDAIEASRSSIYGSTPTGALPEGVAITPSGSELVVANHNDDSLTLVDLTGAQSSSSTVSLSSAAPGGQPQFVAISADGSTAYVSVRMSAGTVASEGELVPVDLSNDQVGTPVALLDPPQDSVCGAGGVAVAGSDVLVTCEFGVGVNVVDTGTSTASVLGLTTADDSAGIGNTHQITVTPDGKTALVTWTNDIDGGVLTFLNVQGSPVTETSSLILPDAQPSGIAVTPDGSTALVAGFGAGQIYVVHLGSSPALDPTAIDDPDGSSAGPDMITIAQAPATITTSATPPAISGTATVGQTLTESNGKWTWFPSGYSYQWEDCSATGSSCTPILGATSQSYTLTAADAGYRIEVLETARNFLGSGTPAASAPTMPVVPPAPVDTAPPTISGSATQGQTLTESHGSWSNTPTTFAYQWQDCDSSGNSCSAIAGATGQTYVLGAADVAHTIRVLETAGNAGGTSQPASSAATAVVGAASQSSGGSGGAGGSGSGGSGGSGSGGSTSGGSGSGGASGAAGAGSLQLGGVRQLGLSAIVALGCAGATGALCVTHLTLTVTETFENGRLIAVSARARRRPKKVKRVIVLGAVTVTVTAGHPDAVKVVLNGAGKRLLARRHQLTTVLTVIEAGQTVARRRVLFKAVRKPKPKHKHKR